MLPEIIFEILRAVLPWLFSGEEKITVARSPGLPRADIATPVGAPAGPRKLTREDLPEL